MSQFAPDQNKIDLSSCVYMIARSQACMTTFFSHDGDVEGGTEGDGRALEAEVEEIATLV